MKNVTCIHCKHNIPTDKIYTFTVVGIKYPIHKACHTDLMRQIDKQVKQLKNRL